MRKALLSWCLTGQPPDRTVSILAAEAATRFLQLFGFFSKEDHLYHQRFQHSLILFPYFFTVPLFLTNAATGFSKYAER